MTNKLIYFENVIYAQYLQVIGCFKFEYKLQSGRTKKKTTYFKLFDKEINWSLYELSDARQTLINQ